MNLLYGLIDKLGKVCNPILSMCLLPASEDRSQRHRIQNEESLF